MRELCKYSVLLSICLKTGQKVGGVILKLF